jgi:hypothetical protein
MSAAAGNPRDSFRRVRQSGWTAWTASTVIELLTAQRVAEAHGGRVWFDDVGGGYRAVRLSIRDADQHASDDPRQAIVCHPPTERESVP